MHVAPQSMISASDPGGLAWIEEQICTGLDASPLKFKAALEAPDSLELVHNLLDGGARRWWYACMRAGNEWAQCR